MHIPEPQGPKLARQLSPAERQDNIQTRQKPAEVNTVLMIAGVYNGTEIASWTEDQQAQDAAKLQELLNMYKFGTVEVVDTLGTNTAVGRILQNASRLSVPMQTSTQER